MESITHRVFDCNDFYADHAARSAACPGEWFTPQRNQLATLLPDNLAGRVAVNTGAVVRGNAVSLHRPRNRLG